MTFALLVSALSVDFALRNSPGATFQCWPLSVITVTVFLLYRVIIPNTGGRPSGCDAIADPKVEHLRMRAHLVQKPQPRHDPVVQIDQFFFVKFIDVNFHDCFRFLWNISTRSLRRLPQSFLLGDLQRSVFVALDHRAKLGGRDILNDAAGFFDPGAKFF